MSERFSFLVQPCMRGLCLRCDFDLIFTFSFSFSFRNSLALYPVYTIEQTSSWLVQLTYSQLVEPARQASLIV